MKQLYDAAHTALLQLADAISQLSNVEFCTPSLALSQATLGQHLRHTIEFFQCLEIGYPAGNVNYDQRQHDKTIEQDKTVALTTLQNLIAFVTRQPANKEMIMEVGYLQHSEETIQVATNFLRELTYNIEHAVHHMALMKIGIREVAPHVVLAQSFGVAVSTLRHQHEAIYSA
ncbi:MAG: hypothetical protein J0L66_05750 [Cytophagales bacterium]|nr:hypothetical protein [Cytophagales bacterium]